MRLSKLTSFAAVTGALAWWSRRPVRHDTYPAFAPGEASEPNFAKVRNAGPEAMRDHVGEWDKLDEALDESFPASDPPGH